MPESHKPKIALSTKSAAATPISFKGIRTIKANVVQVELHVNNLVESTMFLRWRVAEKP
jgi:hypothetical protein